MQTERRYGHFCPMARAIEQLGERWGLLIVRDLLPGERRFTDLLHSCGGVTPRQLSARLRQLEQAGVVERDQEAGRREVRYRLTQAGRDLQPVVDALLAWGVRHSARPPAEGEPVQPYHVLNGTRAALQASGTLPSRPTRWTWRFPSEPYTLRFDGGRWELSQDDDPSADVVVDTTPRAWAQLVTSATQARHGVPGVELHGAPARVREFRTAFGMGA